MSRSSILIVFIKVPRVQLLCDKIFGYILLIFLFGNFTRILIILVSYIGHLKSIQYFVTKVMSECVIVIFESHKQ